MLLIAYALSGCAALIYEVVWTRLLTEQMGQSMGAVSTVLAAFMAGLGAGAIAAGGPFLARWSPRQALRLYAVLEGVIALSAVTLPAALSRLTPLLAFAYANGDGPWFPVARVAATLLLLVIPTAAMGATFPVAARAFLTPTGVPSSRTGALYAANTAGACAGAALAGFVLLPALGLRLTSFMAVALNLLAAAIALAPAFARVNMRELRRDRLTPASARVNMPELRRGKHEPRVELAACALALTGFVALVSEVAWTRVLAMTIGPTTYAFSAMLAMFILGLAIGSAAAVPLSSRTSRPMAALGLLLVIGGGLALVVMRYAATVPLRVATLVRGAGVSFNVVLIEEIGLLIVQLVPLAAVFGAAFPFALRAAARDVASMPRTAALLYAANTAASVAGSLAAGFVLVPLLGLQRTIEAGALLLASGGLVFAWISRPGTAAIAATAAGLAAVCAIAGTAPRWDTALLAAGAYKYAPYIQGPDLESALRAGELLYYRDGAAGTVSVRRVAGALTLAIDGKVDASNAGDMLTQKMLAHLPLMLHPRARRAAIVGLGSGVTLGAALRHPLDRVDTIEISREVVDASRFFEAENHRALADPRARLIVGDGRSHLLLSQSRYDVIVSEPSNPWMAGVAALFTREFFGAARRALDPDGLFCQWAHAYDISGADLRSIAATFASVFPESTMWLVGQGDVLLIGSVSPIAPRLASIAASFARPELRQDLREVAVSDPSAILAMYIGGPAEIARYSAGTIVQTDDRLALEFSAARSLFGVVDDNAATLRALAGPADVPPLVAAARQPGDARRWRDRGRLFLAAEAYDSARDAFAHALAIDDTDQDAVDGLIDASDAQRGAARQILETHAARGPAAVAVRVGQARVLAAAGEPTRALEQVVPLLSSSPDDYRPAEQAAAILADNGDAPRLRPLAEHLAHRWPARTSGPYFIATAAFLEGRADEAEARARALVAAHPDEARLQTLLGVTAASLGHRDAARTAFNAALARAPRDAVNYTNLGLLDLDAGMPESAVGRFAEALMLDPSSAAALRGLAQALRATGKVERAMAVEQAAAGQKR